MARTTSTSKLGNKYDMLEIESTDRKYHNELKKLLSIYPNNKCADCGSSCTSWCSINIGVFICVDCAQIHRSIGTHISKVKSCIGSYLWHPDEMNRIRALGNAISNKYYNSNFVIDKNMSRTEKINAITNKYKYKPEQVIIYIPPKIYSHIKPSPDLINFEDWF